MSKEFNIALMGTSVALLAKELFTNSGFDPIAHAASKRGVDPQAPQPIVLYDPSLLPPSQTETCTPQQIADLRALALQEAEARAAAGSCEVVRPSDVAGELCVVPPPDDGVYLGASCTAEAVLASSAPEATLPSSTEVEEPTSPVVAASGPEPPPTDPTTSTTIQPLIIQSTSNANVATSGVETPRAVVPPVDDNSNLGKVVAGAGLFLLGGFLTIRATLAKILRRDELNALSQIEGVDVTVNDGGGRVGEVESHAYHDGRRSIIPQSTPTQRVSSDTYRRSCPHSHPGGDHTVHPIEPEADNTTRRFDPVKPLRDRSRGLRDQRRASRDG